MKPPRIRTGKKKTAAPVVKKSLTTRPRTTRPKPADLARVAGMRARVLF